MAPTPSNLKSVEKGATKLGQWLESHDIVDGDSIARNHGAVSASRVSVHHHHEFVSRGLRTHAQARVVSVNQETDESGFAC